MGNPARGNQVCDAVITTTNPTSGGDNTVAVQLNGPGGVALTVAAVVQYYLSTDATGQALSTDGTDTSDIVIATDGTIIAETRADVAGIAVSEADGDLDFTVTVVTGHTAYLNIVLPDGTRVVSDVLTYV